MNSSENNVRRPPEDLLEDLLRHASPRTRPPAAAERAARVALHAQWRGMIARRRRRLYWPLAAAASLVLAAGVTALLTRGPESGPPPVTVATVEAVIGIAVQVAAEGAPAVSLSVARPLRTGTELLTHADSGLAMRWRDGSSVRLDRHTALYLTAAGEIRLASGRLYVDAEGSGGAPALVVLTPAGRVRHVGTQYMAAVSAGATTISVRRGRVRVDGPETVAEAEAGEELSVDGKGATRRRAIPAWGEPWQWAQATAPAFAAEGRSVADFLAWVSRESGRPIAFASPEVEDLARRTQLRGRIDLEPMTALPAILQTSDLDYDIREGSLHIRRPGAR